MTEPIKLPAPHGYIYVWDGPYGTHRLTAGQYNGRQCDRTVAYYTEDQVRAAIEQTALQSQGREDASAKVLDELANGSYIDNIPNHSDNSLREIAGHLPDGWARQEILEHAKRVDYAIDHARRIEDQP